MLKPIQNIWSKYLKTNCQFYHFFGGGALGIIGILGFNIALLYGVVLYLICSFALAHGIWGIMENTFGNAFEEIWKHHESLSTMLSSGVSAIFATLTVIFLWVQIKQTQKQHNDIYTRKLKSLRFSMAAYLSDYQDYIEKCNNYYYSLLELIRAYRLVNNEEDDTPLGLQVGEVLLLPEELLPHKEWLKNHGIELPDKNTLVFPVISQEVKNYLVSVLEYSDNKNLDDAVSFLLNKAQLIDGRKIASDDPIPLIMETSILYRIFELGTTSGALIPLYEFARCKDLKKPNIPSVENAKEMLRNLNYRTRYLTKLLEIFENDHDKIKNFYERYEL